MRYLLLAAISLIAISCASVISLKNSKDASNAVTPAMVRKMPDTYLDSKVIWGGIIVSTKDVGVSTVIEVIEAPLNQRGRIQGTPQPQNRFLIDVADYLDPFEYKMGMEIVAVGKIKGIRVKILEKMDYPYPVMEALELHTF